MKNLLRGSLIFSATAISLSFFSNLKAEDWPVWRGPRGDGSSAELRPPTRWSAAESVVWKSPCPPGHASPVISGTRLFTAAYDKETQARLILCFDRRSGVELWRNTVVTAPMERIHNENSHASSTPACDGERVYCTFLDGKEPVVSAFNLEGALIWQKRPGIFSSVHGFCSTPVFWKDKVIVNFDHDGPGYIVAFAREDGRELWRIERPNRTRSYVAPLLREAGDRVEMVLSGSKCIAGYNPDTGVELWRVNGPTDQFVASMVHSAKTGLFYMTGGFPAHHVMAIRPGGVGDVSSSHVAWHYNPSGPVGVSYVPSPIIEGDWLLLNDDRGFAHAFDAKTGAIVWSERFSRQHASLVSAAGLVYFLTDRGDCYVVNPSQNFEVVATNSIGENTYSSPAFSNGHIFLRSEKHLWCIGQPETAQ